MAVEIQNWKAEISEKANDPNVSIRYVGLSKHAGRGLYSSIIPPGGANTGHWHPEKDEYYHITQGSGTIVTQYEDKVGKAEPDRQKVTEGMSFHLPARLVHRLFNDGDKPLTFFFECPLEHMAEVNPLRTIVKNFGETPNNKLSAG